MALSGTEITRMGASGFSRFTYDGFLAKAETIITNSVDVVPAFTAGSATSTISAGCATSTVTRYAG